jgi:hypothetical protein
MKIKIYLLVFIILTPFLNSVLGNETNSEENELNSYSLIETTYFNSVPTWEVGDMWKYKINEIVYINEDSTNPIIIQFRESILTLNVVSVTDDYYHLEYNTRQYGNFEFVFSNFNIKFFGRYNIFRPLKIDGTLIINKHDLSIYGFSIDLSGRFKINFADKLLLTIPIKLDFSIDLKADPGLKIIDFPLVVENIYGLPSFNITVDGDIASPWFRILKIVNNIAILFGTPILPDDFAQFLPKIDLGEILKWRSGDNTFLVDNMTWHDVPLFAVAGFENIVTEAGTFQAYEIILPFTMGSIYYAPDAGSMVKLVLSQIGEMELIETTFEN